MPFEVVPVKAIVREWTPEARLAGHQRDKAAIGSHGFPIKCRHHTYAVIILIFEVTILRPILKPNFYYY
jgi:hypothetical protein